MWDQDKASIVDYLRVWSPFHRQAVTEDMSGFSILTDDRLVQSAQYGDNLKVIANFSGQQVTIEGEAIAAKSAVVYERKQRLVFDAAANAKLHF